MTEEVKTPQADEVVQPAPAMSEAVAKQDDTTIGDALDTSPKKEAPETVPLSTFLELKNSNKKLEKDLQSVREQIESGATKKEVSADIKSLAEKHNVDADFLKEFADTVRASVEADTDRQVESKLKPLQEKERAEKIDTAFNKHFSLAMGNMPEFEGVVNKDVIKSLSLDPKNANKTFSQIIEESYGHLIQGRATIDRGAIRAGKEDTSEVDYDKARKDPKYFGEIMANPNLKKKYNESLSKRLSSYI